MSKRLIASNFAKCVCVCVCECVCAWGCVWVGVRACVRVVGVGVGVGGCGCGCGCVMHVYHEQVLCIYTQIQISVVYACLSDADTTNI
jgi:hypothetical protein